MQTQQLQLVLLVSLLTYAVVSSAQLYYHSPPPINGFDLHYTPSQAAVHSVPARAADYNNYAHPTVVKIGQLEAQLPVELQKSSRFYNNPAIASALAKESWPTEKESIVHDREAEKIPRDMVLKIFKNAGWARRR